MSDASPVGKGQVLRLWAPLAASWLLMAVELPLLTAVVGRLPDERIQLAAYGSMVFPVALTIEGPVIMLLAASTALCSHWAAYLKVRRFMTGLCAVLTAVHVAVAFTPLFDVVATHVMGVDDALVEPARWGLRIMTPWTWSIGYRRFQQGVLIRHGHGRAVTLGTAVRLTVNASTLLALAHLTDLPGIVVGTSAIAAGVMSEAAFAGWAVRPVIRDRLRHAPVGEDTLTLGAFLAFYIPLALTPFITLVIQPLGAGAMSRMHAPLVSLAAWPAVHGVLFITRSVGMAFNEVVVAMLGRPGAVTHLRGFGRRLALTTMGLLALFAFTPLAALWFGGVADLDPEVARACVLAVALGVLMPGYAALQSWYQGLLVKHRTTRPVTEAVVLYSALCALLLTAGTQLLPDGGSGWGLADARLSGVHWAVLTFVFAGLCQTGWLWFRSRGAEAALTAREPRPPGVTG